MKVFELGDDGGVLLAALKTKRDAEPLRTGLHVSTICDDILKTLNPGQFKGELGDQHRLLFFELGNTVEDILAAQLALRAGWSKPEPRQDRYGIWGSPDGDDPRTDAIDEMKANWGTPNGFVELSANGTIIEESWKFYRYRIQSIKYASMWQRSRIRLHVVFVAGSGRPPFPSARTFTIKLTDEDKQINDELLWTHARDRKWLKEK